MSEEKLPIRWISVDVINGVYVVKPASLTVTVPTVIRWVIIDPDATFGEPDYVTPRPPRQIVMNRIHERCLEAVDLCEDTLEFTYELSVNGPTKPIHKAEWVDPTIKNDPATEVVRQEAADGL